MARARDSCRDSALDMRASAKARTKARKAKGWFAAVHTPMPDTSLMI
jgi:hypothetical protein